MSNDRRSQCNKKLWKRARGLGGGLGAKDVVLRAQPTPRRVERARQAIQHRAGVATATDRLERQLPRAPRLPNKMRPLPARARLSRQAATPRKSQSKRKRRCRSKERREKAVRTAG